MSRRLRQLCLVRAGDPLQDSLVVGAEDFPAEGAEAEGEGEDKSVELQVVV